MTSWVMSGRAGWGLAALTAVAIAHLGLIAFVPGSVAAIATKTLLMPLLAAVVVMALRRPWSRVVRLVLLALALSWLGDLLPEVVPESGSLVVAVAFFLLAQCVYIAAFWPFRRYSLPARRPWAILPYLAVPVALLLVVLDAAGGMLAPIAVYAVVLTTMALLASGLGRLVMAGGIVFLLSDSLLAVRVFAFPDVTILGVWIMLAYVLGQALIVLGVLDHERNPSDPAPAVERA